MAGRGGGSCRLPLMLHMCTGHMATRMCSCRRGVAAGSLGFPFGVSVFKWSLVQIVWPRMSHRQVDIDGGAGALTHPCWCCVVIWQRAKLPRALKSRGPWHLLSALQASVLRPSPHTVLKGLPLTASFFTNLTEKDQGNFQDAITLQLLLWILLLLFFFFVTLWLTFAFIYPGVRWGLLAP